jgi:hypothetical protein
MSGVICVIVPCLIIPDILQTSLHKHGTITQITPEIPQTSLHKHLTITQNTADTSQTSLHNYGTIKQTLLTYLVFMP